MTVSMVATGLCELLELPGEGVVAPLPLLLLVVEAELFPPPLLDLPRLM